MNQIISICRLCLKPMLEENISLILTDISKLNMLKLFFPNLNFSISQEPKICNICDVNLKISFSFKKTAIENEMLVLEESKKLGMGKVNLKCIEKDNGFKKDLDSPTCRVCLKDSPNNNIPLYNEPKYGHSFELVRSIICTCIIEMDFDSTEAPVLCNHCWIILQTIYIFKRTCIETEEKLNNLYIQCKLRMLTNEDLELISYKMLNTKSNNKECQKNIEMERGRLKNEYIEEKTNKICNNGSTNDKLCSLQINQESEDEVFSEMVTMGPRTTNLESNVTNAKSVTLPAIIKNNRNASESVIIDKVPEIVKLANKTNLNLKEMQTFKNRAQSIDNTKKRTKVIKPKQSKANVKKGISTEEPLNLENKRITRNSTKLNFVSINKQINEILPKTDKAITDSEVPIQKQINCESKQTFKKVDPKIETTPIPSKIVNNLRAKEVLDKTGKSYKNKPDITPIKENTSIVSDNTKTNEHVNKSVRSAVTGDRQSHLRTIITLQNKNTIFKPLEFIKSTEIPPRNTITWEKVSRLLSSVDKKVLNKQVGDRIKKQNTIRGNKTITNDIHKSKDTSTFVEAPVSETVQEIRFDNSQEKKKLTQKQSVVKENTAIICKEVDNEETKTKPLDSTVYLKDSQENRDLIQKKVTHKQSSCKNIVPKPSKIIVLKNRVTGFLKRNELDVSVVANSKCNISQKSLVLKCNSACSRTIPVPIVEVKIESCDNNSDALSMATTISKQTNSLDMKQKCDKSEGNKFIPISKLNAVLCDNKTGGSLFNSSDLSMKSALTRKTHTINNNVSNKTRDFNYDLFEERERLIMNKLIVRKRKRRQSNIDLNDGVKEIPRPRNMQPNSVDMTIESVIRQMSASVEADNVDKTTEPQDGQAMNQPELNAVFIKNEFVSDDESQQELAGDGTNADLLTETAIDPATYTPVKLERANYDDIENKYVCLLCPFKSSYKHHLIRHLPLHGDRESLKRFKCMYCPYKTIKKQYLKSHMLQHDPSSVKFNCHLCAYVTNRKDRLRLHIMSHEKLPKIFKCPHCPYSAARKTNLQCHMVSHEGEPKFACTECDYKTKRKSHLVTHMLKHADPETVNVFHCMHCPYRAKRKHHLQIHMTKGCKGRKNLV